MEVGVNENNVMHVMTLLSILGVWIAIVASVASVAYTFSPHIIGFWTLVGMAIAGFIFATVATQMLLILDYLRVCLKEY